MDERDLRSGVLEIWRGSRKVSRIKARGRSMEPLIKEGDEVIIRHSGVPEFGDIILYDGPEGLVVHRVIGKRIDKGQTYILEKGDSSPVSTIIPEEKVLGIVIGIEKACSERSPEPDGTGRRESNDRIVHLDSPLSKLIGKVMALYSLMSFKILSKYDPNMEGHIPYSLRKLSWYVKKWGVSRWFLAWILRVSKG